MNREGVRSRSCTEEALDGGPGRRWSARSFRVLDQRRLRDAPQQYCDASQGRYHVASPCGTSIGAAVPLAVASVLRDRMMAHQL